jgi:hypothetical protein
MPTQAPTAHRPHAHHGPLTVGVATLGLTLAAVASSQTQQNNNNLRIQQHPLQNGVHTQPNHLALLTTNQAKLVQSQNFIGHPGPPGSTEIQTHNGSIVRKSADGQIIDVRVPRTGMVIHHGLDGSRHVMVEQPDHSRIYAASRGVSYVQHPFTVGGRTYDHRTFAVQGQLFHQVYRPYTYGGQTLDAYATTRFYSPQFYRWATSRMAATSFSWGFVTNPPPWYGYYRGYFVPDANYTNPLLWLTDFMLASSLAISYRTEPPTAPPAPASDAAPVITPQVKQMLADEVGRQVKQESAEAQANAQNRDIPPASGSIVQELSDGQEHVFVVASDLDLVDGTGRRCMISEGDVVDVKSAVDASSSTALAVVLASKGFGECERAAQVPITVSDLQEMQNHMRETIDQGMANTAAGKKAQTVTPAFAASTPPPDTNAAREIEQQQKIAAAEG